MRTKEERPSVKDVKHSDEVERENFVMEKTEFLPNVQTEEKKENAESVQSNAVNTIKRQRNIIRQKEPIK